MYWVDEDVPAAVTLKLVKGGSSGGGVFCVPRMTMESLRTSSIVKLFLSTVAVTEISSPKPRLLNAGVSEKESNTANIAKLFFIVTNRFPHRRILFSRPAFD